MPIDQANAALHAAGERPLDPTGTVSPQQASAAAEIDFRLALGGHGVPEVERAQQQQQEPAPDADAAQQPQAAPAPDFRLPQINQIHQLTDGRAATSTELVAIHTAATGFLTALDTPRELGNAISSDAGAWIAAHPKYETLSEGAKTLVYARESARLDKAWGPQTAERIAVVKDFIRQTEARAPGFTQFLHRSGLINSASLAQRLYDHATNRSKK